MRLGQAHFPGQTRIFDRRARRGASAAVVARNQNHIGLGLGHPGGNRAHSAGRHQLDRHLGARIDLLQVIDQLRQVFDGIDIVMRRRRDQRYPRRRMAQPRDQCRHLHAGQLPAFAGLCPLRHLDFQLFTGVQVFRRNAKAPGCHLLDLGTRVVAIRFRREMRRVFAALARIGLGPDPVHCDVQRLVRLGRQRAKAHPRRHKALADRGDAFHLFNRHRLAQRLDVQKVAYVDRRVGPHRGTVLLPQVIGCAVAGRLQHMHR